jgi:hypothetical protein
VQYPPTSTRHTFLKPERKKSLVRCNATGDIVSNIEHRAIVKHMNCGIMEGTNHSIATTTHGAGTSKIVTLHKKIPQRIHVFG